MIRVIDGVEMYTIGDVSALLNRERQTLTNWAKYSDQLEAEGKPRLIPKPIRINNIRYYTKEQVEEILQFAKNMKRGDLAPYNRTRIGKRGREIQARMNERKRIEEQRRKNYESFRLPGFPSAEEFALRFKKIKEEAINGDT